MRRHGVEEVQGSHRRTTRTDKLRKSAGYKVTIQNQLHFYSTDLKWAGNEPEKGIQFTKASKRSNTPGLARSGWCRFICHFRSWHPILDVGSSLGYSTSSPPPANALEQWSLVQALGPLPSTWETRWSSGLLDFHLFKIWLLRPLGGMNQQMDGLYHSLDLSNKLIFKNPQGMHF